MARLPYPDPASLPPKHQMILETLPPLNVFRMMAGAGSLFPPFIDFINAYLNDGALPQELRELVILRVGHLTPSTYEVFQHERVSRTIGMSEDRIAAAQGALPNTLFSELENTALQLTDEIVHHVRPSDALFAKARSLFSDVQIQELTIIAGFYMMVCRYLEALDIEKEEFEITVSGLDEIRDVARQLEQDAG